MKKIKVGFTDFWEGYVPEDSYFLSILRQHYDVEIFDTRDPIAKREVEYLFCGVFSHDFLDFDCIRILYTGENLIPDFNLYDYAIGFEKMEVGDRYFWDPLCYTCIRHDPRLMHDIQANRQANHGRTGDKKFCAMVVSNGENADMFRTRFFHELSKYKTVDSGGRYLNNIGGNISDKISFLRNYRFSLAMENVSHKGYCTEKITESFAAGTVPIYWGDENVTQYFNKRAFVNCHDCESIEEVVGKVKEIDNDDGKYIAMLNEPVFSDYYHTPDQQDIRFEKWFLSIFEREYQIRRDRIGWMKNYEEMHRVRRDALGVKWTTGNCPYQEKDRLVLYGAGNKGGMYYRWICENRWGEVVGWIDKCRHGRQHMGYPVSSLDLLQKVSYDYVLITIESKAVQYEVTTELVSRGVPEGKILVI